MKRLNTKKKVFISLGAILYSLILIIFIIFYGFAVYFVFDRIAPYPPVKEQTFTFKKGKLEVYSQDYTFEYDKAIFSLKKITYQEYKNIGVINTFGFSKRNLFSAKLVLYKDNKEYVANIFYCDAPTPSCPHIKYLHYSFDIEINGLIFEESLHINNRSHFVVRARLGR